MSNITYTTFVLNWYIPSTIKNSNESCNFLFSGRLGWKFMQFWSSTLILRVSFFIFQLEFLYIAGSALKTWLKLRYSEKATKNLAHLPLFIWHYFIVSNYKLKIGQICVAFSEYPNFNKVRKFLFFILNVLFWSK